MKEEISSRKYQNIESKTEDTSPTIVSGSDIQNHTQPAKKQRNWWIAFSLLTAFIFGAAGFGGIFHPTWFVSLFAVAAFAWVPLIIGMAVWVIATYSPATAWDNTYQDFHGKPNPSKHIYKIITGVILALELMVVLARYMPGITQAIFGKSLYKPPDFLEAVVQIKAIPLFIVLFSLPALFYLSQLNNRGYFASKIDPIGNPILAKASNVTVSILGMLGVFAMAFSIAAIFVSSMQKSKIFLDLSIGIGIAISAFSTIVLCASWYYLFRKKSLSDFDSSLKLRAVSNIAAFILVLLSIFAIGFSGAVIFISSMQESKIFFDFDIGSIIGIFLFGTMLVFISWRYFRPGKGFSDVDFSTVCDDTIDIEKSLSLSQTDEQELKKIVASAVNGAVTKNNRQTAEKAIHLSENDLSTHEWQKNSGITDVSAEYKLFETIKGEVHDLLSRRYDLTITYDYTAKHLHKIIQEALKDHIEALKNQEKPSISQEPPQTDIQKGQPPLNADKNINDKQAVVDAVHVRFTVWKKRNGGDQAQWNTFISGLKSGLYDTENQQRYDSLNQVYNYLHSKNKTIPKTTINSILQIIVADPANYNPDNPISPTNNRYSFSNSRNSTHNNPVVPQTTNMSEEKVTNATSITIINDQLTPTT